MPALRCAHFAALGHITDTGACFCLWTMRLRRPERQRSHLCVLWANYKPHFSVRTCIHLSVCVYVCVFVCVSKGPVPHAVPVHVTQPKARHALSVLEARAQLAPTAHTPGNLAQTTLDRKTIMPIIHRMLMAPLRAAACHSPKYAASPSPQLGRKHCMSTGMDQPCAQDGRGTDCCALCRAMRRRAGAQAGGQARAAGGPDLLRATRRALALRAR